MAGRTYETAIKIGAVLSGTFRTVTGGATGAMKKLVAEAAKLSAVSASTEHFARLTNEVKSAQRQYNLAADALDKFAAAEKAAGKPTKDSAKWMDAGARAVKAAEKELKRAQSAATNAGVALHIAGVNTAKLSQEQARLAGALGATERRMATATALNKHFGHTIEAVAAHFKKMGTVEGSLSVVGSRLRGLASSAAKLGGVGLAAGFGLFELVKHTAEHGDAISDAAKRTNTGVVALQTLRLAGELSGASVEDVDTAMGKLAVNIGKVNAAKKKGGGLGAIEGLTVFPGTASTGKEDPFHHIGLSAKALAKLKPEQQVDLIADKIAKLTTHSAKAAAAVAIFGKGGLKFLPALLEGSAGIKAVGDEALRTGQILSVKAVGDADEFNDQLRITQGAIGGVVNILGAELLPVGTKAMKELTTFVASNREAIRAWAEKIAVWVGTKAVPAIKDAAFWIRDTGGRLVDLVTKLAGAVGGFGNLGIAIAALRVAPLASSILQLGWNLGKVALALIKYTAETWAAVAAQRALQAAQAGGGVAGAVGTAAKAGAGSAAAKAGGSFLFGTAGAGAGTAAAGSILAIGAALKAGSLGAALSAGGVAGFALPLIIAGAAGAGIGTGIRKLFNTDDLIAGGDRGRPLSELRATPRTGAGAVQTINFAPTINAAGAPPAEVRAMLQEQQADLLEKLKALKAEERRLAFQ